MTVIAMNKTNHCTLIEIQEGPLDAGKVLAFLQCPEAGALDVFVGTTRQFTDGRETALLYYEAYVPMALREMNRLAEEAGSRWPLLRVCLMHRLGSVPIGEASVLIGVSTAHRSEAFEACRWLIDALKVHVPIWKRETFADGRTDWVEGQVPRVS